MRGQRHAPAPEPSVQIETRYPSKWRIAWPQRRFVLEMGKTPPKRVELRPVQPVAYKLHRRRSPGNPIYELEEMKYASAVGSVYSDSEYNLK